MSEGQKYVYDISFFVFCGTARAIVCYLRERKKYDIFKWVDCFFQELTIEVYTNLKG